MQLTAQPLGRQQGQSEGKESPVNKFASPSGERLFSLMPVCPQFLSDKDLVEDETQQLHFPWNQSSRGKRGDLNREAAPSRFDTSKGRRLRARSGAIFLLFALLYPAQGKPDVKWQRIRILASLSG